MATIRDVARLAGVSAGTVSNFLNRPSYLTQETRDSVQRAIDQLGFEPSQRARQFRRGRERTLGLAVADIGNPFFVDVALGAEEEAKKRGVGVVMVHNNEDATREEQNLDLLIQQRVQGIIITPVDERNPRLEQLMDKGIPIVFVDRISGDRPCCWLATDDKAGGRLAGQHLLELGHKKIAFVGSPSMNRQVQERYFGLVETVQAAGYPVDAVEVIEVPSWKMQHGKEVGKMLSERDFDRLPTAVFCANDMIALGLMDELLQQGFKVPEDISIVGFDDLSWSATAAVPLTSVKQPCEELGRTAVQKLLEEIDSGALGDHEHEHVIFAPELSIRKSTAKPRSN